MNGQMLGRCLVILACLLLLMVDYKGLQVLDTRPPEKAAGGRAIYDNFKELADRVGPVVENAGDPDANDDSANTNGNGVCQQWTKWYNTTDSTVFICLDATATAAVWARVLSNIVEDASPQLGGNLDGQAFDVTTTGDGAFGDLGVTGLSTLGNLDVDTLNLNGNTISDSTGTISFNDDILTTTGQIGINVAVPRDELDITDGGVILNPSGTPNATLLTNQDDRGLILTSPVPRIIVEDNDGVAGKRVVYLTIIGGDFILGTMNDVGSTTTTAMKMNVENEGFSFGVGDNYLSVDRTGVVTLAGSAQRVLTLRPDIDESTAIANGKPTLVHYGVFNGYSLPLYAADEEIFFALNVPGRWNGSSDITIHVLVALSAAETVDDDFNLQLSWESSEVGEPLVNTTHDVTVETNIPAGRNAQYDTFEVTFTVDWDADDPQMVQSYDLLSMRLRRLAVAGVEIAGEIIVLDAHAHFTVDKMFKAP